MASSALIWRVLSGWCSSMKVQKGSPMSRQTSSGRHGFSMPDRHGQSSTTILSGLLSTISRARVYGSTFSETSVLTTRHGFPVVCVCKGWLFLGRVAGLRIRRWQERGVAIQEPGQRGQGVAPPVFFVTGHADVVIGPAAIYVSVKPDRKRHALGSGCPEIVDGRLLDEWYLHERVSC